MATFVLVHGAWHGAWCWDKVVPLLEERGHRAVAIDLPGHGEDRTPIEQVTVEAYKRRACETLDAQTEPVVLVGHSMGGIVISSAAEERPERIRTLVYLAAFLLRDGQTVLQVAEQDVEAKILPNLVAAPDGLSVSIKVESLRDVFYHDCPADDVQRAYELLVPQAVAPLRAPLRLSDERFGRVPRAYIECLQDHAISPAVQKRMYEALTCQKVISLDRSHSPFFSAPGELAEHLASLA